MLTAERTGERAAVCLFDLDNFKPINDTHGHAAGDYVLKIVSERLRGLVRETDVLARLGGDEFAAVLCNLGDHEDVNVPCQRILAALSQPIPYEGKTLFIGASKVGIILIFSIWRRTYLTPCWPMSLNFRGYSEVGLKALQLAQIHGGEDEKSHARTALSC